MLRILDVLIDYTISLPKYHGYFNTSVHGPNDSILSNHINSRNLNSNIEFFLTLCRGALSCTRLLS